MVDPAILASRLGALEEYLERLETFRTVELERYLADPDLYHLAERYLHLSCECILDAAQHIVSDEGYRQPTSYKDTFAVLRDEGVLEADLAERLQGWMGFRNVLVHLYLTIDHELSFLAIRDQLEDLRLFAEAAGRFLSE